MIYYINIFWEIVVGAIILYGVHDNSALFNQKSMALTPKKIYCIFSGVLWILISGLRSLSVGSDTESYYISYTYSIYSGIVFSFHLKIANYQTIMR